ncbi:FAD-dependent monooxygenase [Azohydromonas caseinilytica]|uniref:2-octaprenyl-6-methoxyphenyl hydroxylase n=1 Tax=Azohydromonas caseinilytica TaxID=2728836 RepID=A0A848FEA7_9BURK|nr:FAD-dependent monooxygenase [Azohydromonas caseinilytica]NML16231.1 2-octaprenyl-6-methoxyphenyl hydroxylase [Azohydromonas caseinilytica]
MNTSIDASQASSVAAAPAASRIAVVGAGPVGLALGLLAARHLPQAQISLFDARALDKDIAADPRVLALSLGSVQLLQQLRAWDGGRAQPIQEVLVSQQPPGTLPLGGEPQVRIRAAEEAVPMLGAVQSYGAVVAPLQRAWLEQAAQQPQRLFTRFGTPVASLKPLPQGVEVDAGIAESFDLAVVAEGGVFAEQARKSIARDYAQTAWIGTVTLEGGSPGLAIERFTRQGPAALLPLPPGPDGLQRAALVWCVDSRDDPVKDLNDAQRLAVLSSIFPPEAGRLVAVTPMKHFALGLNAERTLARERTVRIGNAAQTLHPVAGQGLNLGLRDAFTLVQALRRGNSVGAALRRVEFQRAPDRWSVIAATDFLARSFTWQLPGLPTARALGLALLQAVPPLRSALARQMMFGRR